MHDYGHSHTHGEEMSENISGLDTERVVLSTVGIDIGSSTTHLIFSRIVLQRESKNLSSRFVIVERRIIYESPIYFTPYLDSTTIDASKLEEYLIREYDEASQTPESVDTGAVIITGEAAMKHNAATIISLFSGQAGKFVCATAGPNLEAALAAYGSGSINRSQNKTVLNVDIGGGTIKFACVRNGNVLETAAVSIGARLMAWDSDGKLTRIEKTSGNFIKKIPNIGDVLSQTEREFFVNQMTGRLFEFIDEFTRGIKVSPAAKELYITPEMDHHGSVDEIIFSGGVAEFIYHNETEELGDFGSLFGSKIREQVNKKGLLLGMPKQRIRATVIGASQYTVQLSGNTIFLSTTDSLPIRNTPVFSLDLRNDDYSFTSISRDLQNALHRFDLSEGEQAIALGIRWSKGIDYPLIHNFCKKLSELLPKTFNQSVHPLIIAFDADIGGLVGRLLLEEFRPQCPIVSIDQVDIRDFDYIDIGEPLVIAGVVPVVIKSLIFS